MRRVQAYAAWSSIPSRVPPWTLPAKLAVSGVISTVIEGWWSGRFRGLLRGDGAALAKSAYRAPAQPPPVVLLHRDFGVLEDDVVLVAHPEVLVEHDRSGDQDGCTNVRHRVLGGDGQVVRSLAA